MVKRVLQKPVSKQLSEEFSRAYSYQWFCAAFERHKTFDIDHKPPPLKELPYDNALNLVLAAMALEAGIGSMMVALFVENVSFDFRREHAWKAWRKKLEAEGVPVYQIGGVNEVYSVVSIDGDYKVPSDTPGHRVMLRAISAKTIALADIRDTQARANRNEVHGNEELEDADTAHADRLTRFVQGKVKRLK